jgi:hypothetical protein
MGVSPIRGVSSISAGITSNESPKSRKNACRRGLDEAKTTRLAWFVFVSKADSNPKFKR